LQPALAIYFILKAAQTSFKVSTTHALIIGVSLALSFGSRFSYFLTVAFLVVFMLRGILREPVENSRARSLVSCAIIAGTPLCALVLLLAYNYARFGSLTEFGMKYAASIYSEYLLQGNFFRYNHIPYNLWSYMFSLPRGDSLFPYIQLPFYILKVESISTSPYYLWHVNELCSSVFCFLPVLLFCFVPVLKRAAGTTALQRVALGLFAAVCALQILPVSMSMAAITRYYFDFLPMMMVIAFLGLKQVQEDFHNKNLMLIMISAVSILFSLAVTVNAVRFYASFWPAQAQLLKLH